LSSKQLNALVQPTTAAITEVSFWLRESGVDAADIKIHGEWVNFVTTIAQAEAMLNTKFHSYQNQNKKSVIKIRTLEYSIPEELFQYVDLVQPTTRFAQIKAEASTLHDYRVLGSVGSVAPSVVVDCNLTITPTCLRDLYNINGFTPDPKKGGFIGISGFLEEYAQFGDLQQWIPDYAPWAAGANFTWTSVNGELPDRIS
jgi:tripeptidyl-peptidase-1